MPCGAGFVIFCSVDREGHWMKMISERQHEGREGGSPADVWGESIIGR